MFVLKKPFCSLP